MVRLTEMKFSPPSFMFKEQEFIKSMMCSDTDNDGTLDFEEFKVAIKNSQEKIKKCSVQT